MSALDSVAPDIAKAIASADGTVCRRVAVRAAEFALDRSGLQDPRAVDGLNAIRDGRVGPTPERSAVEALAASLDERQLDIQDLVDAGAAMQAEYVAAFTRARAASAIFFAGELDSRNAALEAVYEASAVVDDVDELRAVVCPLLQ